MGATKSLVTKRSTKKHSKRSCLRMSCLSRRKLTQKSAKGMLGDQGSCSQKLPRRDVRGGSYESCIKDELEGCGALDTVTTHDSYVKCVHHCVDHCNREGEI